MEQIVGVKIMDGRNGREYNVPELPHFSLDGYCPETRKYTCPLGANGKAIRFSRSVTSPP